LPLLFAFNALVAEREAFRAPQFFKFYTTTCFFKIYFCNKMRLQSTKTLTVRASAKAPNKRCTTTQDFCGSCCLHCPSIVLAAYQRATSRFRSTLAHSKASYTHTQTRAVRVTRVFFNER
jgi:hypothetical protein